MITFNFKKPKKEVEEKYNFPVLTQKALTNQKGSVAKFTMNKALIDSLGLDLSQECNVSMGLMQEEGSAQLVLVNTTGMQTPHQFHVNNDGSLNSKSLLNRLVKFGFEFDETVDNEFSLYEVIDELKSVAFLSLINVDSFDNTDQYLQNLPPVEDMFPGLADIDDEFEEAYGATNNDYIYNDFKQ
jgi:hypothetical protein